MILQSQEDYLRAIFFFQENNKEVRSIDLVKYLKVSKPSVSEMLKKLQKSKLIKMKPYSNIILTAKGGKNAKQLTYKHRVIEVFLHEVLKVSHQKIHHEAHRLEHAFSLEMTEKLYNFLNQPKFCPGGREINK